jgi:tetrahydromethanopterin:alpha-L-glutamate ligase
LVRRAVRVGVVGVPGAWSSERLADAVAERTGVRLLIDMGRCAVDPTHGRLMHGDVDLCELDGLIIKKLAASYGPHLLDRLELLRYVRERGVPVFSSPQSILRLINRVSCTLSLAAGGVMLPPTTITESLPQAMLAVRRYGQAVLKPLYSSKGRGMQLVSTREGPALEDRLVAFQSAGPSALYIQKHVPAVTADLGVVFLGEEYVGTYARVNRSAPWLSTNGRGREYAPHDASPELIALASRARAVFQLALTTVDILETPEGPLVLEVSAFGGFRGTHDALGIDLAARYARHVVDRVSS